MRFNTPLCQATCLVITVILHSSSAQYDLISIEAFFNNSMQKFEQQIIEKIEAQQREVIETLAAHTANVKEIAESINNVRNITDKLLASKSHIEEQLTNVKNELYQSIINVFPSSCATLNIKTTTNTYYIRPAGALEPFLVLCDFEDNYELGGGWTVFQRRLDGSVDFYQNWTTYKNGFGDVNGEHWLGLEKLHAMTKSGGHEMLVLLEDQEGNSTYAYYGSFKVASEAEQYKLTVGNYSGTAGDSLSKHNGMKFSTLDEDNDLIVKSCAEHYSGAWWFNYCYSSHLNGKFYKKDEHVEKGIIWHAWKGEKYSLKSTKMMMRRRSG